MTASTIKKNTYTVTEAAEILGLSAAAVRRCCQTNRCTSEYHKFPGTNRGFYLIPTASLDWIRRNVSSRNRATD